MQHIGSRIVRSLAASACLAIAFAAGLASAQSLRFYGHGTGDIDRVKIRIDPHVPADVCAGDCTIEFWIKTAPGNNGSGSCNVWRGEAWITGNTIIDRDRYSERRKYGIALLGGRVAFGVLNAQWEGVTICTDTQVTDGEWHHVAFQRRASDGRVWAFRDGVLEHELGDAPGSAYAAGDISFPNGAGGWPNDRFIVIGAEKHDAGPAYPSFKGWIDELRFSTTLRYSGNFARPTAPHVPDSSTAALYHFDEGSGAAIGDSSASGASPGVLHVGGSAPAGPVWSTDTPFAAAPPPPPPPPPPPTTYRLRALTTGFMVRGLLNADGSPVHVNGVPANVYVGDSSQLPACDANDQLTINGIQHMRVTAAARCPYGHALGVTASGYAQPCDPQ